MYSAVLESAQAVAQEDDDSEKLEELKDGTNENKQKGMVLPFEPHSITFDNIRYSVDMPQVSDRVNITVNLCVYIEM